MASAFSGVTGMSISPFVTWKRMENKGHFHLSTWFPVNITRNSGYTRYRGKIPMPDKIFGVSDLDFQLSTSSDVK